jgi:hypothetical protein
MTFSTTDFFNQKQHVDQVALKILSMGSNILPAQLESFFCNIQRPNCIQLRQVQKIVAIPKPPPFLSPWFPPTILLENVKTVREQL